MFGDTFGNFGDIFGNGRRTIFKAVSVLVIVNDIKLSFIESIIGTIREFEYQISLNCDDCNGTGASNERDSIIRNDY